jgi:hypothetical protein
VACRDRRRNLHSQLISLPSRSNLHRADTHIIEAAPLAGVDLLHRSIVFHLHFGIQMSRTYILKPAVFLK